MASPACRLCGLQSRMRMGQQELETEVVAQLAAVAMTGVEVAVVEEEEADRETEVAD